MKDLTHIKKVCENSRKKNVEKNLLVALRYSMRGKNNNNNIYNYIIVVCYNQATESFQLSSLKEVSYLFSILQFNINKTMFHFYTNA